MSQTSSNGSQDEQLDLTLLRIKAERWFGLDVPSFSALISDIRHVKPTCDPDIYDDDNEEEIRDTLRSMRDDQIEKFTATANATSLDEFLDTLPYGSGLSGEYYEMNEWDADDYTTILRAYRLAAKRQQARDDGTEDRFVKRHLGAGDSCPRCRDTPLTRNEIGLLECADSECLCRPQLPGEDRINYSVYEWDAVPDP